MVGPDQFIILQVIVYTPWRSFKGEVVGACLPYRKLKKRTTKQIRMRESGEREAEEEEEREREGGGVRRRGNFEMIQFPPPMLPLQLMELFSRVYSPPKTRDHYSRLPSAVPHQW